MPRPRFPPSPGRSSAPLTRLVPPSSAEAYPAGSGRGSVRAQSLGHPPRQSPCSPDNPPASAPAPLQAAETCCRLPAESWSSSHILLNSYRIRPLVRVTVDETWFSFRQPSHFLSANF